MAHSSGVQVCSPPSLKLRRGIRLRTCHHSAVAAQQRRRMAGGRGQRRDHRRPLRRTMPRKLPPVHPGQVLKEDFMTPLDLGATKLGHILGVPPNRITEIVRGRRQWCSPNRQRLSTDQCASTAASRASSTPMSNPCVPARKPNCSNGRRGAAGQGTATKSSVSRNLLNPEPRSMETTTTPKGRLPQDVRVRLAEDADGPALSGRAGKARRVRNRQGGGGG